MHVEVFTVGPFLENTYLLTQGDEALLIDPGFARDDEFRAFRDYLGDSQASLRAVVLTHAHVDHVLGLQRVVDEYDVPVYLNDTDRYLWQHVGAQARMFGMQADDFSFTPAPLQAQKDWETGSFVFDLLYTPGHAPDHISLYHKEEQIVIAGDVLFKQGIGRTDLYKGDAALLETSIREQLYTLPDETVVYPGHGPGTTVGYEKRYNPFVRENSEF